MLMQNFTKLKKNKKSCLIHSVETWDQEMNGGPGTNWLARRAEQFPHLGNDTLTPAS